MVEDRHLLVQTRDTMRRLRRITGVTWSPRAAIVFHFHAPRQSHARRNSALQWPRMEDPRSPQLATVPLTGFLLGARGLGGPLGSVGVNLPKLQQGEDIDFEVLHGFFHTLLQEESLAVALRVLQKHGCFHSGLKVPQTQEHRELEERSSSKDVQTASHLVEWRMF
ncbi:hypothetical protein EYF80_060443 [Liparis tanakae]|uniref:Uncharacterized protein n=1 Tax=Liparis tanakae TaxID=230148 RepID=A0A4Z2EKS1_9TELE|nr:hypothetical protein EYF80_060443 [Liparis tanakae]